MKTKSRPLNSLLHLIFALCLTNNIFAVTLQVGYGYEYPSLTQATTAAQPGDTILIHSGTYPGGLSIANLQGTSTDWIHIFAAPGNSVIYNGGSTSWHMIDAAFVYIKGIIFQQQTVNGFNIDDGGSYETPSHYIIFEECTFQNINATGNNDLLKMAGIDNFEIRNCDFINGSPGGSGIDMVGCHDGLITGCHFKNHGEHSISAKGGSKNIRIEKNIFKNGGQRSVALGGSTGLPFFRPLNATYEAANLKVYANVFIGSEAPIAYVGCINTEVINNTIYMPTKWVMRILQETVDISRFAACGNNTFQNNIVYYDYQVSTDCNIGPNTEPMSFTFSNNLWYHTQNAWWSGPTLPVPDANQIIGQNPLFLNEEERFENFNLEPRSPAIGAGYDVEQPVFDFNGNTFNSPRSIGAFEGNNPVGVGKYDIYFKEIFFIYPNPSSGKFTVKGTDNGITLIEIYNLNGEKIFVATNLDNQMLTEIDLSKVSKEIYFVKIYSDQALFTKKIVIH